MVAAVTLLKRRWVGALALLLAVAAPIPALANESPDSNGNEVIPMLLEPRWRFFTDQVMGGQSIGEAGFLADTEPLVARLAGRVSTANNGGFIQIRLDLETAPPEGIEGVRFLARGNDQRYYVHLRTSGSRLPWQYYQAGFDVTQAWTEIRLPFADFVASGALLRNALRPDTLRSVAVVAYGRDHDALIDVHSIGFY